MKPLKGMVAGLGLAALAAGIGYAQEVPPNGPFGGGRNEGARGEGARGERRQGMRERMGAWNAAGRSGGGIGAGNEMLLRLIQDPQVVEAIGLTAEKAKGLKEAFVKVQEKQIDLQAELSKLNLQQTGLVAGLLADRTKNPDEAFKLVEEIGKVNTAISKLAIERMLAVRDHLTDEQIAKARDAGQKRMEEMRARLREGRPAREGGDNARRERGEGGRRGRE